MRSIDTSRIGDRRLWRLSLLAFALLAACSSTPKPEAQPLVDATADTDYRLETVSARLRSAETYEAEGNRALAIAVLEAAQGLLPPGHEREFTYIEVAKATVWAREGEGRDARMARDLMVRAASEAQRKSDYRLLGDIALAEVLLLLADYDKVGAARKGDEALRAFTSAGAHARAVEAARDLAFQFTRAGDVATAHTFARRAFETTERIADDVLLIQTCVDVGRIEPDRDRYFLRAYEAAYRIDSLGWRNVVIAIAADAWYSEGSMQACIRWGDRIRTRADGALPALEDTGLYTGDYLTLLAQYAFAREQSGKKDDRAREAAALAVSIVEAMPETERGEWLELAENLRSGLLQPEREK